jgi:uracil-DNA glycosylase family 4
MTGVIKWQDIMEPSKSVEADKRGKFKRRKKGKYSLGCEGCPLNKTGNRKILGHKRIKQRRAMLWAQAPGKEDAERGRELKGKVGRFIWDALAEHGLSRADFDIQNVVRCRPITRNAGFTIERDPTKEEIVHCSEHTEEALRLNEGNAEVHIVFGKLTAETLLGREYKKDRPIFWSETLAAKVFVLDHPSYFLRGQSPEWRLKEWKQRLAAACWAVKNPGRFAWLDRLKIVPVYTADAFSAAMTKARNSGERIAVDIEDATVNGENAVLCISFSWGKNSAVVAVLDHPENMTLRSEKEKLRKAIKRLLEAPTPEKIFHYGSYDTIKLQDLLGIDVQGYTFDTTYAHYLKYTFLRSHGLATIGTLRYPHYAAYWDIVDEYWKSENMLADCPLDKLIKYNGADAALTKRIEMDTRDDVSLPLVQIYIGAGRTLWRMEKRGPRLDRTHFAEALSVIPAKVTELTAKIRQMADDPELNPNTPAEIAYVMYQKLKLPTLADISDDFEGDDGDLYNTREATLAIIHEATKHPFPQMVLDYRRFAKMQSTYLSGYERSADLNDGELRTKWYLTGAVTGRLRSGGTKDGVAGVINMQNLHGSPYLKNLLVSDDNWREMKEIVPAKVRAKLALEPGPFDGKKYDDDKKRERMLERWKADYQEWKDSLFALADKIRIPDDVLDLDVFLAFDYSQIEIRMLAECSGDPLLIKQFKAGLDIHCAVGNTLNPAWSFDYIKKDKETRSFIKNCHFGLVYGLSEEGLYYYLKAKGVDTTPEKAAQFHRDYFAKYKGVAKFIEKMQSFAMNEGYVENLFGFVRRIGSEYDEERTTNPMNQAVNSPIQGAAHCLLLAAMAMLDAEPGRFNLLQTPIMEVHDALVFKVKLRNLRAAFAQAKKLLEEDVLDYLEGLYGFRLKVPLVSEGSVGLRYGVLVDYDGGPITRLLVEWFGDNEKTDAKMRKEFPLPVAA